jgi:hypothetical protein
MTSLARLVLALVAASALTLALPTSGARACWDGFHARVGAVEESGGRLCWSEREVRERALWLGRIDALLPSGASVVVTPGLARVTLGSRVSEVAWAEGRYASLFRAVARALGASADDVLRARGEETPVYVVEVASFGGEEPARSYAAALTADGVAPGFVEVGPGASSPASEGASAPVVHVEPRDGGYAVYVGAFVDADEAEAARAALGERAIVREL